MHVAQSDHHLIILLAHVSAFSATLAVATHPSDTVCPDDLIINHIYTLHCPWSTTQTSLMEQQPLKGAIHGHYKVSLQDPKHLVPVSFINYSVLKFTFSC